MRLGEFNSARYSLHWLLSPLNSSVLIASWLCSILEALIIRNVYHYFNRYKSDHILLKLLVAFTTAVGMTVTMSGYAHLYMVHLLAYFLCVPVLNRDCIPDLCHLLGQSSCLGV